MEALRGQIERLGKACAEADRDVADLDKILLHGFTPDRNRPLESVDAFVDFAGRHQELGFTEISDPLADRGLRLCRRSRAPSRPSPLRPSGSSAEEVIFPVDLDIVEFRLNPGLIGGGPCPQQVRNLLDLVVQERRRTRTVVANSVSRGTCVRAPTRTAVRFAVLGDREAHSGGSSARRGVRVWSPPCLSVMAEWGGLSHQSHSDKPTVSLQLSVARVVQNVWTRGSSESSKRSCWGRSEAYASFRLPLADTKYPRCQMRVYERIHKRLPFILVVPYPLEPVVFWQVARRKDRLTFSPLTSRFLRKWRAASTAIGGSWLAASSSAMLAPNRLSVDRISGRRKQTSRPGTTNSTRDLWMIPRIPDRSGL